VDQKLRAPYRTEAAPGGVIGLAEFRRRLDVRADDDATSAGEDDRVREAVVGGRRLGSSNLPKRLS
jgi:hypothetical protein